MHSTESAVACIIFSTLVFRRLKIIAQLEQPRKLAFRPVDATFSHLLEPPAMTGFVETVASGFLFLLKREIEN